MRRHLTCVSGGLWGLLLGLAAVAHAQAGGDPASSASALDALLPPWAASVVHDGGLPGALLVLGWWARGLALKGIPAVVSLSEEDRSLFRRGLRALERQVGSDESDDPKPATNGAKP